MNTRTQQATELFALPNEAQALEVSTTYPLSEPSPHARARLGRYARLQFQDFFAKQGLAMVVIAFALMIPMWSAARSSGQPIGLIIEKMFGVCAGGLIAIGTLLSVRGVVSDDTQHGFHRFLFSKPLDVGRYYAQSLAVRFAGFLAVLLLLMLPFAFFAQPVFAMLAVGALFFTLAGGVGFLLSTITKQDVGVLMAVGAVSGLVQGLQHVPKFGWLKPLALILPPLDAFGELAAYILRQHVVVVGFPVGALIWVVGYGLASVAAGLAILRRRAVPA